MFEGQLVRKFFCEPAAPSSPDLKLAIAGGYGVASRVHAVSRYDRQVLEYPALHEGVRG